MGTVIKSVNGFKYEEDTNLFCCKDITKYNPNRCPLCGAEPSGDTDTEEFFDELRVTRCC